MFWGVPAACIAMRLSKSNIERLQQAKNLIDKNIAVHYTIPEIGHEVGISPTPLKRGFKQLFGMGLYKYLLEQKLEKGKYLIENTDHPLKYISRQVGYKYEFNFSTAFKKRFGKSPSSFRKN